MAKMNAKEVRKMSKNDKEKKLKELQLELIKARAAKTGSSKTRMIRRLIARILTLNK